MQIYVLCIIIINLIERIAWQRCHPLLFFKVAVPVPGYESALCMSLQWVGVT